MKEKLIKLAKENGFSQGRFEDIPYRTLKSNVYVNDEAYYLWLCLLQKWLLEEHKINIPLWVNHSGWWWELEKDNGTLISSQDITETDFFQAKEESLEKGCYEALLLIK